MHAYIYVTDPFPDVPGLTVSSHGKKLIYPRWLDIRSSIYLMLSVSTYALLDEVPNGANVGHDYKSWTSNDFKVRE